MTFDQIYAVAYARFSPRPAEQAASTETLQLQLEACRAYCLSRGWEIAGEYTDPEESGKDLNRPGITAALAHLDRLAHGALVVYRQNRLTRSKRDLLTLYERFKARGHVLALLDLGIDTSTPTGEAVLFTLAAWDERERKEIAIKTKEACNRYQRNGRSVGGKPPYGWRRDLEHAQIVAGKVITPLVPDEAEQGILRLIFDAARTGQSCHAICQLLAAAGSTTRCGTKWHSYQIRRILARGMKPVTLDADNVPVTAPTAEVPSPGATPA